MPGGLTPDASFGDQVVGGYETTHTWRSRSRRRRHAHLWSRSRRRRWRRARRSTTTSVSGGGRSLQHGRRAIALIFQQFNLIRRLTAMENVLVGRLADVPTWRVQARQFTRADRQRAL